VPWVTHTVHQNISVSRQHTIAYIIPAPDSLRKGSTVFHQLHIDSFCSQAGLGWGQLTLQTSFCQEENLESVVWFLYSAPEFSTEQYFTNCIPTECQLEQHLIKTSELLCFILVIRISWSICRCSANNKTNYVKMPNVTENVNLLNLKVLKFLHFTL